MGTVASESEYQLALIKPPADLSWCRPLVKNEVKILGYLNDRATVRKLFAELYPDNTAWMAADIETRGTQAANLDCIVVGLGLSDGKHTVYFDLQSCTTEAVSEIYLNLQGRPLIGHNVFFDSAFLLREVGEHLNWSFDTYGAFRQLANEGFPGQKWGLKDAQVKLLGWVNKGDVELDEWLVKNGLSTGPIKHDASPEERLAAFHNKKIKPNKGEMWQAPSSVLGYYCGLDAYSTYKLHQVMQAVIEAKPWKEQFLSYHDLFMENTRALVEQQLTGITVDLGGLQEHLDTLTTQIDEFEHVFLTHPKVAPHVKLMQEAALEVMDGREPDKYKKQPAPRAEPNKFTKAGAISKGWLKWNEKQHAQAEPVVSKNWLNWKERRTALEKTTVFNINSGKQLEWLFYEQLGYPVIIRTDTGQASTGVQALPGFGELGRLLKQQKDRFKERGYVEACLRENLNSRVHPQFRNPGTLTCRLAGSGGINIQQLPKSRAYLECWRPEPGRAWVQCDHTALEQVVLAELSQDPTLLKLYGPDANPNDVYLFNGAQLPVIGKHIRATGYDPDKLYTSEQISEFKKSCKKYRQIAKTITLGQSYGMGAGKLKLNLELQGVSVSDYEAKQMVDGYRKLYSGVQKYQRYLETQYRQNRGWVYNGIGRPVCCAEDYVKDLVNRVVQSTGHDIHMFYIRIVREIAEEQGVSIQGIVWDFHDESIVECAEEDKEKVYKIFELAYDKLNEEIQPTLIKIKGGPEHINNLADAKCS